jgi:hypothetical protein
MADAISLLNFTLVDQGTLNDLNGSIEVLSNWLKAVGGILALSIIAWLISLRNMKKQQKLLSDINKKLDKLTHKRKH